MNNNSGRQSKDQAGISGDGIILLVFLFVGGILFAAFMLGSVLNNGAGTVPANLPTNTVLAPLFVTARSNVTGTVTLSANDTPLAPGTATETPLHFRTFTPKPIIFYPTNSYYSYKSSTPIRIKTLTPTRTATRTVTSTVTPSVTGTATRTLTLTPSQTATATITLTATTTITLTPTNTATPTPSATPAALVCLSATPSGQIPLLDTWIDSVLPTPAPTPSHGSDLILKISASGTHSQRALFQFTAPTISSFSSASLHLYVTSPTPDILVAYRLTREFNNDANWLDAQPGISSWYNAGGDYSLTPFTSYQLPAGIPPEGCWVSLDVAAILQHWIDNPSPSLGFILIPGADGASITISSLESLNSPLLEIK